MSSAQRTKKKKRSLKRRKIPQLKSSTLNKKKKSNLPLKKGLKEKISNNQLSKLRRKKILTSVSAYLLMTTLIR